MDETIPLIEDTEAETQPAIEVRFGDIAQIYLRNGSAGDIGVVTGLSENHLDIDKVAKDKEGRDVMGVSGTCSSPVKVIGHWGSLEQIIEAHKVGLEHANVPRDQWPELIAHLEADEAKGVVTYIPSEPREKSEPTPKP